MTGKTKAQLEGENIVMRNVIDRMKAESRDCSKCVYLKIAQENPAIGAEPVDDTARKRAKWLHKHGVGGKHHGEWMVSSAGSCWQCGDCPGHALTAEEHSRILSGQPFHKPPKRRTP